MSTLKSDVEKFHLLFLDQLSRNIDDAFYAVKGGCNLRFFFKSIRYSEDLDIDVQTIRVETLQKKIERILDSNPLKQILNSHGISIERYSSLKQTQTTQRWKLTLRTKNSLAEIIFPLANLSVRSTVLPL